MERYAKAVEATVNLSCQRTRLKVNFLVCLVPVK